jgi:NAD(P)-dependent dehydrogenase (short-subunit alcohol dehydrogenase family)
MQQLQGKVAFITGAGRGVGKGLARAFAAEGATVIIASRNVEVGTAAAQEISSGKTLNMPRRNTATSIFWSTTPRRRTANLRAWRTPTSCALSSRPG